MRKIQRKTESDKNIVKGDIVLRKISDYLYAFLADDSVFSCFSLAFFSAQDSRVSAFRFSSSDNVRRRGHARRYTFKKVRLY
jgi:hypothetical protein